jgi:hypothetical protein
LGASQEAALSSCRMDSCMCIARRSYWRRPETIYPRSFGYPPSPERAVCSPTEAATGVDIPRRAASYVDCILRGAPRPADAN